MVRKSGQTGAYGSDHENTGVAVKETVKRLFHLLALLTGIACSSVTHADNLSNAQYQQGLRYETGRGIKPNYPEVTKWYRKAAEQGHPIALYNLNLLHDGFGGTMEAYEQAVPEYRKATMQGSATAQNHAKAQKKLMEKT